MKLKQKTKKSIAKRFRRTKKGKLTFGKANRGHLLGNKSRKRKRHLRSGGIVSKADQGRFANLLAN